MDRTDRFTDPRLPWLALALISLAGLVLRIRMAGYNEFPSVDGVMYMDQARQLVTTGRMSFSCFPPGWPALIALPLLCLDAAEPLHLLRAAQGMNVALGTLLPVLTFLLLRPRLGAWAAVLGALVTAFLPQDLVLAKGDLSETAYACGLLGGWLLHRRGLRLPAGLLLGYTYLVRPEALLAAAALILVEVRRDRAAALRLAAGVAVFLLPYLLYIKTASGTWGLSSKDVALTLSLEAHPGLSYFRLVLGNLRLLLPQLTGMLGLPLVLLAVWGAARSPGRWLLMLAPLLPVPFIINPMVVRFWQPYVPFFLLAAGLGIGQLRRTFRRPRLTAPVLLILALAGLGQAARDDALWIRRNPEAFYGLRDAGEWLRANAGPGTVVAAYKPYASFWGGCGFLKLPDEDDPVQLVAWARNHGADYLVANVLVAHTLAPGLVDLLQDPLPAELAGRLELVELFRYDIVNHNTALYRINDPLAR